MREGGEREYGVTYRFNFQKGFVLLLLRLQADHVFQQLVVAFVEVGSREDDGSTLFATRDVQQSVRGAERVCHALCLCAETRVFGLVRRSFEKLVRHRELMRRRAMGGSTEDASDEPHLDPENKAPTLYVGIPRTLDSFSNFRYKDLQKGARVSPASGTLISRHEGHTGRCLR